MSWQVVDSFRVPGRETTYVPGAGDSYSIPASRRVSSTTLPAAAVSVLAASLSVLAASAMRRS